MFEELDPVIAPLEKLLAGIEHCLYGPCDKSCPFFEPNVYEHGEKKMDCSQELLFQVECRLKGHVNNADIRTAHGWDGETDYYDIVVNDHYIRVGKKEFDAVNRAMREQH